jgi:hypothetical protein
VLSALALAVGCASGAAARPAAVDPGAAPGAVLADDDRYQPSYGKRELEDALIAERAVELTLAHRVAEFEAAQPDAAIASPSDDALRSAVADLAVRRRFIATLEACQSDGRWCPPRLDDPPWSYDPDAEPPVEPPMTAPLRFDLASWRALAAELHGRACACRTLGCVDSVELAIAALEPRPVPHSQGDELASLSITRARECLFRLRGRSVVPLTRRGDR